MHANSRLLFEKHAKSRFTPNLKVLEIGPDGVPSTYAKCVNDPSITWHTLDVYESPTLTYRATGDYSFPIPDGTYDIVLSGQVIEHVKRVWDWMAEVARVCKPGGLVVTINPVSWEYHEAPVDCWRIYPEGMRTLCAHAGLDAEVSVFESLESLAETSEPVRRSTRYIAKQAVMRLLGRHPDLVGPSLDTITVARKK